MSKKKECKPNKVEDVYESLNVLTSELSTTFINLPCEKIKDEIKNGLQSIVDFLGVSKGGILEALEEGFGTDYIYVQDGSGPYHEEMDPDYHMPGWSKKVRNRELVNWPCLPDCLPDDWQKDREFCDRVGVKSHLTIPVFVGERALYIFYFSDFHLCRSWPDELVRQLGILGNIFSNALERKKQEEKLQGAFQEIKKLKDQLEAENTYLRNEIKLEHNYDEIIGKSAALKDVLFKTEQVARTDASVLIQGETGVGKELFARAIHNASLRKDRPLIKVNCATLPANLIESELFGHEKGAFTGAQNARVGRFELAHNTTIFLDEIGELPLELQPKLLRVLQEGEFERLGSSRTIKTDVRVIAATNRDLLKEVKTGRFRQDLWFRLNVFPIVAPPLRDRVEDIPLLVKWFVDRLGKKMGKKIQKVPSRVASALQGYSWPGNIRELEHVIERAIINSPGETLCLMDDLDMPQVVESQEGKIASLANMERDHILRTLKATDWRVEGKGGAAILLGIKPSTLRARMKKLGISRSTDQRDPV